MGNRVKKRSQEPGTKNQVWVINLVFFLGSWFLVLGSLSAQGAERIVSLNACTDELLLQFAAPDQIAGVTRLNHSPLSNAVLERHPEILRVSSDVESILKLSPTRAIAEQFSSSLLLDQLRRAGISIHNFDVPRNWNELTDIIKEIIILGGNRKNADHFYERLNNLGSLKQQSQWKGKRAVFWSAAGHVSGRNTFENTVMTALGMVNAIELDGYSFLLLEQLIALKPQVLVVTESDNQKDSWSHTMLYHSSLRRALPDLEYVTIPEEAVSCASEYSVQVLENLLKETPGVAERISGS